MRSILLAAVFLLAGCDQVMERAGFPDPARVEAEGKAIGGACRHAGRGLEDCYRLNAEASKAAVYAGWKEMNEYMARNNITSVEPTIPPDLLRSAAARKKGKRGDGEEDGAGDDKPASAKDAGH